VRTDVGMITQTDLGYTGQRNLDAQGSTFSLGLMDYRARMYSSLTGRFIQPDTITPGGPQGLNRYSYGNNNPLNYTDPSGHCTQATYSTSVITDDLCEERPTGNGITPPLTSGHPDSEDVPYQPAKPTTSSQTVTQQSQSDSTTSTTSTQTVIQQSQSSSSTIPLDPTTKQNQSGNPPPLLQRAATAFVVAPLFMVLDVVLLVITLANTFALGTDPEPLTKSILLVTEIFFSGIDITVAFAHWDYVHWVVTGKFIKSVDDLSDWELAP
jgi:RHS repeat-associated protein